MVCLMVAVVFILCGFILMKWPPKSINCVYGYRTPFSRKNKDTWDESQKHSGLLMMILGVINGIFGAWAIINPISINNEQVQGMFLLVGAVIIIVIEEIHLKKLFNKDGLRK